jgi:peptide/nickel transport system ATP-binding protein
LLLDRVSLAIDVGETVVVLSEADSGAAALMHLLARLPDAGEFVGGRLRYGLLGDLSEDGVEPRIAYVPGPQYRSLSPGAPALAQLTRVIARKLDLPLRSARAEFEQALAQTAGAPALSTFEARAGDLAPADMAWGMLVAGLAQTPELLLVDHLFEGVPPRQARLLEAALLEAKARLACTLVCATMTTETPIGLGGRLVVLRHGQVVEEGPVARVTAGQAHGYTQSLFRERNRERSAARGEPVVRAIGLKLAGAVSSRDEINFELRRGASVALVGEDGSGRRGFTRVLLGMERAAAGRIVLDSVQIGVLSPALMTRLRRRTAIVTGADDVLDPRMTLWDTVAEPLRAHLQLSRSLAAGYRENALRRVGLASHPADIRVSDLSPFDRRRLQIARAMVSAPSVAIIDEPFRGLDAFARSVIRDLLQSFRDEEGPAFLVITSDFSVARALCDEALVFQAGRLVERGPIDMLLRQPKDAETQALIAAARLGPTLSPMASGS